ncbi:MAG: precorrin-6y C5,15-methyltransferase (decarboxylating) subunit CbiE [Desulfovibrio sp.]|uniref:precorrin-6y C5,15-methyltransferase (decarboxylating) subunit CbiE n=1 Tax=Desulfovibrio sp. TaxID=885 RepID=UPI001A7A3A6F|nr:precorrin-6y C5,15-methyltransferase (decarboxylating) subunit CbiE [Desulfovibrio sp.]MBD5416618.1 precorrin-6y C5,15-methyltransferase (decarboxylating) subunit CbiE [Desulfovibrio sp.]
MTRPFPLVPLSPQEARSAGPAPEAPLADAPDSENDWPDRGQVRSSLFVFMPSTARPEPITVLGLDCTAQTLDDALTPPLRRLLDDADVVCAPGRLLEQVPEPTGRMLRRIPLTLPLEPLLQRLANLRSAGAQVLVLSGGDPLFFGIGATMTRQLGAEAVRVVPAASSLQAACARLALPWHKVICLSLHGRDDLAPLNAAAGRGAPLCILTDARMTPDVIARHLLDRGVDWFTAHVFERMGAEDESRLTLSLAEAVSARFGPACVLILVPSAPVRRPRLGIDDAELATDGCFTRKPVRAAALSLLAIGPRHAVWDIGAGSGAVALEAAALAHEGRVIAVERDPGRAIGIQENRRRFGAATVEVCLGRAPDCLRDLPEPQRIFIGGGLSGADGAALLAAACGRLTPGGRLVASCVLLESVQLCREGLQKRGWPLEIMQIQASEARPLGRDAHLAALNPVFLLAARKPGGRETQEAKE